jgi:hypothetical protein
VDHNVVEQTLEIAFDLNLDLAFAFLRGADVEPRI